MVLGSRQASVCRRPAKLYRPRWHRAARVGQCGACFCIVEQHARLMTKNGNQGCEHTQIVAPEGCQVGTRKAGLRSIGQKSGRLMAGLACLRERRCLSFCEPKHERAEVRVHYAQGKLPAFIRPPALGGAAKAEIAQHAAMRLHLIFSYYLKCAQALRPRQF